MHDKARPHTAFKTKAPDSYFNLNQLAHQPYSPDRLGVITIYLEILSKSRCDSVE